MLGTLRVIGVPWPGFEVSEIFADDAVEVAEQLNDIAVRVGTVMGF